MRRSTGARRFKWYEGKKSERCTHFCTRRFGNDQRLGRGRDTLSRRRLFCLSAPRRGRGQVGMGEELVEFLQTDGTALGCNHSCHSHMALCVGDSGMALGEKDSRDWRHLRRGALIAGIGPGANLSARCRFVLMEGSLRPLARSFVTNQLFEEAGASAADVLA